jgi:hypothetical protein
VSVTARMMEEGGPNLVLLALLRRNGAATVTGEEIVEAHRALMGETQCDENANGPLISWRLIAEAYVAPDEEGMLRPVPALYEVWARGAG